MKAYAVF